VREGRVEGLRDEEDGRKILQEEWEGRRAGYGRRGMEDVCMKELRRKILGE
jgi:hypothetical protein